MSRPIRTFFLAKNDGTAEVWDVDRVIITPEAVLGAIRCHVVVRMAREQFDRMAEEWEVVGIDG